jgi:DNA gyrase subunit B
LYRLQKGKAVKYAFSDEERDAIIADSSKSSADKSGKGEEGKGTEAMGDEEIKEAKGISIQRYKGLGEMNPGQLWETTMDPEKRILKRVTIEDAIEADRLFDSLMGNEVLPRKKFIQSQASFVKELDV